MSDMPGSSRRVDELELDTRTDSEAAFVSPRSSFTLERSAEASDAAAEGEAPSSSSGLGSGYESGEDASPGPQPGSSHSSGMGMRAGGDMEGASRGQRELLRRVLSNAEASASPRSEDGRDPSSRSWRAQPKHIFILSSAGKPIFTRHGDENSLAGLMAVAQALVSFLKDHGDQLISARAGRHQLVVLERGPLLLVAASMLGEPIRTLALHLELLHGQIIAILTRAFERRFQRDPGFDARALLGGTSTVLKSLLHSCETDPSSLMQAFAALPLPAAMRHSALVPLHAAVKAAGAVFGLLLAGDLVVALAQSRASPLHPLDLLLLTNFVTANGSFRQSESFSPVCLPRFNSSGFLHAYIHYIHQGADLCMVLLAAQPDAFFSLSEAGQHLVTELEQAAVIQAVVEAVEGKEGGGRLTLDSMPAAAGGGAFGAASLLHFVYKYPSRSQFVSPAFLEPLDTTPDRQGMMQAYAHAQAILFRHAEDGPQLGLPPHRTCFERGSSRCLLAYVGAEALMRGEDSTEIDPVSATTASNPPSPFKELPTFERAPDVSVSINLARRPQAFEGFGTSLCWWANIVGGLPEPLRSQLVDLVFDPDRGLGMQCARYNIGGSGWDHVDKAWLRYGADIDSYWGPQRQWDWSLDAGQRWVAQAAQARGCCIFEAFSNSPPYWMTWSGCASGNYQGWMDNLRPEFHDAFVQYLVTVVKHFRDNFGLSFRTLDPFNESTSTWWQRSGAQEGCHFGTSLQEVIVKKTAAALEAEGLAASGTCVSASDETNIDVSLANMRAYQPATMAAVGQINTHAYWGSPESRTQLHEFARAAGKRLWMSEFGCGNHPLADIQSGLDVSRAVLQDLNVLQATAWIYWQAIENTESNNTWGLLQTPFHASSGSSPDIRISKQYWGLLQYSRWVRCGSTILACDNPDTLIATSPPTADGSLSLIIVSTNFDGQEKLFTYDLGHAAMASGGVTLDVHRTSPCEDCAHVGTFHLPKQQGRLLLPVQLQALSITTIVVQIQQPSSVQSALGGEWAVV
ncbi:hypothetical protein WJX84_002813 [Apatococcus fuscideae]|uniref:Endo-beta-1,6-galactanase-like domain-containing protein n=1 Tax=Apatococcus fuscideae TaxID=2026836 RepID=A0AAW1T214_9CHLO